MNRDSVYIGLLIKTLILGIVMLFQAQVLSATNANDSVIDVPNYLIARWQRGIDKQQYDNSSWIRNTSFTVTANPELTLDDARYTKNLFNFGFYLTKGFTPSSTVSFGAKWALNDNMDYDFSRVGFELGYLWNISNFYYGLDMKRRNFISANIGLEGGSVSSYDYSKAYFGGHLGLRFSRAFSPHTTFFLEPRIGLYSDSYDAQESSEGVDAILSGHLGMDYKLSAMLYDVPRKKEIPMLHMRNWFMELSASAYLPVPRDEYVTGDATYADRIYFGPSFALGYRVNPLSAVRARFSYINDKYYKANQYVTAVDYRLSGTNVFLGENGRRYIDMAVTIGPVMQITSFQGESENNISWGGEAGLQFTGRITPTWELFVEPRFQIIQNYTSSNVNDMNLKKRWDMSVGMVYIYERRINQRLEETKPLSNWYLQSTIGVQPSTFTGGHQLGSFDFSVGRNFGSLWSLKGSVFSQELESKEEGYDESYNPMFVSNYGGRFEVVGNFLRMFSPSLQDSRWNWNVSGGVEFGRLTNHHNNDWALVVGSQLQYRFLDKAWVIAGARYENPFHFNVKHPYSAHLGIQYDLKDETRIDILKNYWRWYIQGGAGFRNAFFNKDLLTYGAGFGLNVTPVNGARLEFLGSKMQKVDDGTWTNWMSISPEYVFNLTNSVFGEDDKRRVDLELFTGLDVMLHKTQTNIGFNLGSQLNWNFNKSLALFVQPRLSFQPFDDIIAPSGHDVVQYNTLIGLRYTHNKYYTTKDPDKYRELLGDKQFAFYEKVERQWQRLKRWRPFKNVHIKPWHPIRNLRKINRRDRKDEWKPLQNWYFQTTWDAQLPTLFNGHQLGAFDFVFGRTLSPLWSLQASVFSGELQSDEWLSDTQQYDETNNPMFASYFGGRGEIVFNALRLFSPAIKDSRWNWNVAAGFEYGQLTNHLHSDWAFVASSQLQYRLTPRMWLVGGGKYQKFFHFDAKLPLSGTLGIQYDLKNEKRIDILRNHWRWYVQGGGGFNGAFFNMDRLSYNAAFGMNVSPAHGFRIEFIGTKPSKGADGTFYNWMSFTPEYVYNLTNKVLGEDDKRRVDLELLAGVDLMMHKSNFENTKVGFSVGTQVNCNLTKWLSIYIQPRFSYQPFDEIIAPTGADKVNYFTSFGVRYNHNFFKSTKK